VPYQDNFAKWARRRCSLNGSLVVNNRTNIDLEQQLPVLLEPFVMTFAMFSVSLLPDWRLPADPTGNWRAADD
jgi:hypothetical protein